MDLKYQRDAGFRSKIWSSCFATACKSLYLFLFASLALSATGSATLRTNSRIFKCKNNEREARDERKIKQWN